jgi:hypothetical protein
VKIAQHRLSSKLQLNREVVVRSTRTGEVEASVEVLSAALPTRVAELRFLAVR